MNTDQVRKIVDTKTRGKVDGQTIDTFSAGAVIGVYDRLSAVNQAKYAAMDIGKAVTVAFKLLNDRRFADNG